MNIFIAANRCKKSPGHVVYGTLLLGSAAIIGALAISPVAFAKEETLSAQPSTAKVRLAPSPLQRFGRDAENHGIYFNLKYTGIVAANPVGGERQGSAYNGQLRLDTIFNMDKLAGIKGGSLHISFTDRSGENLALKRIDSDVYVQHLYGANETYILSKFEWVQRLFDSRIKLMVGRMDVSDTFDRSQLYCRFLSNMDCGNPILMSRDTTKAAFPTPVWGGAIRVRPTLNIYATAGIYQVDSKDNLTSKYHGFNWSTSKSTGYTLPVEIGYEWRTPGAVDDNRYDIGIFHDHSRYSPKTPFGKYFYPQHRITDRDDLYIQGQQMVWQAEPRSKRGVYVAANALFGLSGSKQEAGFQWNTDVIWQGPIASRPNDSFGMSIGGVRYNSAFLNALYASRRAEGGSQYPQQWLYMAQMGYSVHVNSWLSMHPSIEWMIHPNGLGFDTYAKSNVPNAFVVGLEFNIGLSNLLGMPNAPHYLADWVDD